MSRLKKVPQAVAKFTSFPSGTRGCMLKKFLRFVLPSMVAFAFTGLYSIVDGFFVGNNVGDDGLAAINVAYPLVAFINAVGTGIGMGGSVMLSIARGRGDARAEKRYLGGTLFYLAAASVIVTALLVGVYPYLIDIFGAEGVVNAYADDYIFVLACFATAQIFSTGCVPLLRNFGTSFGAMFAMASGFVTNIVLDWLFVDHLAQGVYGAAVATGIGQIVTVIPCALYLAAKIKRFGRGVFRTSPAELWRITRVGISPFGVLLCPQIITVILNKFLFVYGDAQYVAAYSVIMYVYCVDLLLLQGVGDGVQPLISLVQGDGGAASAQLCLCHRAHRGGDMFCRTFRSAARHPGGIRRGRIRGGGIRAHTAFLRGQLAVHGGEQDHSRLLLFHGPQLLGVCAGVRRGGGHPSFRADIARGVGHRRRVDVPAHRAGGHRRRRARTALRIAPPLQKVSRSSGIHPHPARLICRVVYATESSDTHVCFFHSSRKNRHIPRR